MFFDVIIVGGGLVGASLACALRDQSLTVALIDQNPLMAEKKVADTRALALSLSSITCLKTLGIWSKIEDRTFSLQKVHVSKQGSFGVTEIVAAEEGLPFLGAVVNASVLNTVFNNQLKTISNLHIFQPDEIIEWKRTEKTVEMKLKSKKSCSAKLVVGADGTDSFIRSSQGIGIKTINYEEVAVIANVETEISGKEIAFERFLSKGSLAMLPFEERSMKSVWVLPKNLQTEWLGLSDVAYLARLQKAFGYRLGMLHSLGKRISYPLRSVSAELMDTDRFILIGNAVNTLHPIAAQGFNLGLRDVAFLAEVIALTNNLKEDIGGIGMRRLYRKQRVKDHHWIKSLTDRLATPSLFQWLGILGAEAVTPLKQWIVSGILGKNQPLPKLCRGVPLV